MKPSDNFLLLVRNLRKKNHEKLDIRKSGVAVAEREEGTKGEVSPAPDRDIGR
jgi:hypothetical protein